MTEKIRLVGNALCAAVAMLLTGCGDQPKAKSSPTDHDHNEWWCQEHGVPEHECSLCLDADTVKKEFKDKGDWCKIHNRAQSQCFKCDPKLYKTFEDKYVAKYNKKPKPPKKSEFEK